MPKTSRRKRGSTQLTEAGDWEGLLLAAQYAYEAQHWAELREWLDRARQEPDAPALGEDERWAPWQDLACALELHQLEMRRVLRAALPLLVRQIRERSGAAGAPDPTPEELLTGLLTAVETLDLTLVDDELAS